MRLPKISPAEHFTIDMAEASGANLFLDFLPACSGTKATDYVIVVSGNAAQLT